MLIVKTNAPGFEYDIHSLVKAFYPGEEIKVMTDREADLSGCFPVISIQIENTGAAVEIPEYPGSETSGAVCKRKRWEIKWPEQTERPLVKNHLKQLIYSALSETLGKMLPWGTLTGIRPTKIAMGLLEGGAEEKQVLQQMREDYLLSEEKGALALEIALRERKLLSSLHYENGYSLYIGIPFCPTTCLYCSFTSYPISVMKNRVADYLNALKKEMAVTKELFTGKVLDTVYIGGGTPTTLTANELDELLTAVEEFFDLSTILEYTVEAGRADSITREKLQVMKAHSITRISVNPQTMNDETLKCIGRQHTVSQVEEAFAMAREEGFDNINMDIILGLPGEKEAEVERTLNGIRRLDPDSLTVHSLAIKRASKLSQWIEENGLTSLHNTEETMKMAAECAAQMNMKPYYLYRQKNMSGNFENVGYARENKNGIYNILIMEEKQSIAALGAGSISKRVFRDGRIERSDNVKDVDLYLERIEEMLERKRKLFLNGC